MNTDKHMENKYKHDRFIRENLLNLLKGINNINTNNNTIMLEYLDNETNKVVNEATSIIKLYIGKIKGDIIMQYDTHKEIMEIEIVNKNCETVLKHTLNINRDKDNLSLSILREFMRVKDLKLSFIKDKNFKDLNDILNCGFRLE